MSTTRQQILATAARLFEKQGYHATGLSEIIRESGMPKGSLYYYFPQGKEQIGAETALWSSEQTAGYIRMGLSQAGDPAEAVRALAFGVAKAIEESGFSAGGPLMLLAAESAVSSQRLNTACRDAYARMQSALAEKLSGDEPLARFVLSALEGAILLCRVHHSGDPLRRAGEYLQAFIQQEMRK